MKQKTSSNFKLGLMVTIALAMFVVTVYLIGSKQNLFGNTFQISAVFKNVNGLQAGNNVRFSGINVGTVDRLSILSDSTVEVFMKIDTKVRQYIKKDALAGIGSDGLVGNMLINIGPGSGDFPPVEHMDRIASYRRTETDDILSTLSSTNENIAILSRNLLTTTKYINEGQGAITALLTDSSLVGSFKVSLSNLERATANSANFINSLNEIANNLDQKDNLLNLIASDTTITSEMTSVVTRLDEASRNLHQVTAELKEATSAITSEDAEGPLNALLYDSTITNDMKESIENIRESTILLNENLEAMRDHFLFRKYFKKQEKQQKQNSTKNSDL